MTEPRLYTGDSQLLGQQGEEGGHVLGWLGTSMFVEEAICLFESPKTRHQDEEQIWGAGGAGECLQRKK